MLNTERRVVITVCDGLYYNVQAQVSDGPYFKNYGGSKMVHENQLEDTIATIFRGPSIIPPTTNQG